jgi:hypothetical protein
MLVETGTATIPVPGGWRGASVEIPKAMTVERTCSEYSCQISASSARCFSASHRCLRANAYLRERGCYLPKYRLSQYRNATKNVPAKTRLKNSILFVHSPSSASSSGLLLNSIHAIAPEHTITISKDVPVNQVSHIPMLWVNAYTAIITTQAAAATQNTTISTGSAARVNRPCAGRGVSCSSSLLCLGRYIPRSFSMIRMYRTSW